MRKSYWIWLVLFLAIIVMAIITSGGRLEWYLSLPAFFMVIAPAFLLSLGCFGLGEIASFFRSAFRGNENRVVLKNAVLFFDSLKRYFILAGVIGGFCGAIAMLISEDTVAVARGAGLITVTVLYGVAAYVCFALPFATAARKRLNEASGAA